MQPAELFDAWELAWAGRRPAAFRPLCAPDVHYEDPLTPQPLIGVEELMAHAQGLWAAFPDVRVERAGERLFSPQGSEPCYAAAPCRLLGTHRGPLGQLPPTDRFLSIHVIAYCELDKRGLLQRVRAFYDAYDAATQLGVLPARGGLGEKAMLALRGFGVRARREDA